MVKQYPERPKTLEILRDRFANDPDEEVRNLAQKQLEKLENMYLNKKSINKLC
jgi:hypothetical protein